MNIIKMHTKYPNLQKKIVLRASNPTAKARGVALITVMLFLIALTGLAVWTARQSLIGESMARNQLDRAAATQAAEAALRDAERDLTTLTSTIRDKASCSRLGREGPPTVVEFSADCTLGYCFKDEANYATSDWSNATTVNKSVSEPWWPMGKGGDWNDTFSDKPNRTAAALDTTHCNFKGGVPLGTFTGVAPITGVAIQPEYLVELYNMTKISPVTKQEEKVYRITARGFGYTQRTQVVLQTIFIPLQE
jgi:type IV pilus assembly protein PilX